MDGQKYFEDDLLITMSTLEEKVVRLGVCPKCHTKSLRFTGHIEENKCHQCKNCLRVWIA